MKKTYLKPSPSQSSKHSKKRHSRGWNAGLHKFGVCALLLRFPNLYLLHIGKCKSNLPSCVLTLTSFYKPIYDSAFQAYLSPTLSLYSSIQLKYKRQSIQKKKYFFGKGEKSELFQVETGIFGLRCTVHKIHFV